MECGCFCCLQTFPAAEVIDWIDDGDTPLCPHCGIAAVLPGVTDLASCSACGSAASAPQAAVRTRSSARDDGSSRRTTRWVWIPRPSTPSRIMSPGCRNTGSGFMPAPTPGGVPVAMTSPACSVMKWLT